MLIAGTAVDVSQFPSIIMFSRGRLAQVSHTLSDIQICTMAMFLMEQNLFHVRRIFIFLYVFP